MYDFLKPKFILNILLVMLGWRIVSAFGHYFPVLELPLFILVFLYFISITVKKRWWGILMLFSELIIGSQGHMLEITVQGFSIPIRLAMFAGIFLIWLFIDFKLKEFWQLLKNSRIFQLFIVTLITIKLGFLLGLLNHPFSDVFFDANGYFFLGLAFPLITYLKSKEQLVELLNLIFAGTIFMAGELAIYLYVFFHGFGWQTEWYKWLRDTRLAEITPMSKTADFYRIFFQSYLYAGIALCISIWASFKSLISRNWMILISGSSIVVILTSSSRSIWYALAVVIPILIITLIVENKNRIATIKKVGGSLVLSILLALSVILIATNLPLPVPSQWYAFNIIGERLNVSDEAGASTRWKMLPPLFEQIKKHPFFGDGFGTSVTYNSDDPRIKTVDNPTGQRTTYAFEWGILDTITEIGIIGTLIFMLFWISLQYRLLRSNNSLFQILAAVNGFILLVHITTPYLNHPLGLGMITVCLASYINQIKK